MRLLNESSVSTFVFLKVGLAHLHNSLGAGNLQHLAASLGAIRQREVNDLSVPGKL